MTTDIMAQNLSATLASLPGSLGYLPARECIVATFIEIPADSSTFAEANANATAHGQQTTGRPTAPTADPEATYQAVLAGLPAYGVHLDVLDDTANAQALEELDELMRDTEQANTDLPRYPLAQQAKAEAADLLVDAGIGHYTDDSMFVADDERAVQQLRYLIIIDDAELFAEVERDDSYLYRIFGRLRDEDTAITLRPPLALVVTDGYATGKDYYALNAGGGMTHINGQIGDIDTSLAVRAWRKDRNFEALPTIAQIDAEKDDNTTAEQANACADTIAEFVMRERDTAGVLAPSTLHLDRNPHDLDAAQIKNVRATKDALLERALYWQERLIGAARSLVVLNGTDVPINGKDFRVVFETLAYVYSYSPDENVLAALGDLPAIALIFGDSTDDPRTSDTALRIAGTEDTARIIRIACNTLYQMDFDGTALPKKICRTIQLNALRHLCMLTATKHERNEYLMYRDGYLFGCDALASQSNPVLDTKFLRFAEQTMPPRPMHEVSEQALIETSIVADMLATAAEAHPKGVTRIDITGDINDAIRKNIAAN